MDRRPIGRDGQFHARVPHVLRQHSFGAEPKTRRGCHLRAFAEPNVFGL